MANKGHKPGTTIYPARMNEGQPKEAVEITHTPGEAVPNYRPSIPKQSKSEIYRVPVEPFQKHDTVTQGENPNHSRVIDSLQVGGEGEENNESDPGVNVVSGQEVKTIADNINPNPTYVPKENDDHVALSATLLKKYGIEKGNVER